MLDVVSKEFLTAELRNFLKFTDEDISRLHEVKQLLQPHVPEIISYAVESIGGNAHLMNILQTRQVPVEAAIAVFTKWYEDALNWNYESDSTDKSYHIGWTVHVGAKVGSRYVLMHMTNIIVATTMVLGRIIPDQSLMVDYLASVQKALMFNLVIMLQSYDDSRLNNFLSTTGFSMVLYEKLNTLFSDNEH